jgi:hypothetical protein
MANLHLHREPTHGAYALLTVKTLKDIARAKSNVYGLRGYSTLAKDALISRLQAFDATLKTTAPPPPAPPLNYVLKKPIKPIKLKKMAVVETFFQLTDKIPSKQNKKAFVSMGNEIVKLYDHHGVVKSLKDLTAHDIFQNKYFNVEGYVEQHGVDWVYNLL